MTNSNENTIDVILIRHAQSTWNAQSKFTGWANPDLTAAGINEAEKAAMILNRYFEKKLPQKSLTNNTIFDTVYTSKLLRAQHTARIILEKMGQTQTAVFEDWRLNERHYGKLQGLNKIEIAEQVGEEQVHRWRRGYEDKPAPMAETDPHHPTHSTLYNDVPKALLPSSESLADTRKRSVEFWLEHAVPDIQQEKRILISAHGNTLRGLIMYLSGMSIKDVETFEIPTGVPIVYQCKKDGTPVRWFYLDEEHLKAA